MQSDSEITFKRRNDDQTQLSSQNSSPQLIPHRVNARIANELAPRLNAELTYYQNGVLSDRSFSITDSSLRPDIHPDQINVNDGRLASGIRSQSEGLEKYVRADHTAVQKSYNKEQKERP